MAQNAMTEEFEEIELFGKPALFSNFRIDRYTVPKDWYCYDLRGSDYDPGRPIAVEPHVVVNHAGTVLMPVPVDFPKEQCRRYLGDGLNFLGYELTMNEFCEEHGLPKPDMNAKYELRPAFPDEAGIFYALKPEKDAELGCIGHVRMDFGRSGKEFWTSWFPRGSEELNSEEFKTELDGVVAELRNTVLKDEASMSHYCREHDGKIDGGWRQNYGYIVETENYRYCLRCSPGQGDYHAYLTCFDKRVQELNQNIGQAEMTMGGM